MFGNIHYCLPATVNLDSSVTPGRFLHSTVVSLLANVLDAFIWRVDVILLLIPLPAMLVRVAMKGGLEVDTVEAAGKVI